MSILDALKKDLPLTSNQLILQTMKVTLETTQGSIIFNSFADIAPITCENFTTHCKNGYYNDVIFHRIIEKFMIQGGDPTGTGRGGESIWGKTLKTNAPVI